MRIACMTIVMFTGTLAMAEATPKDDLKGAARRLAAIGNYTWTTTAGAEGGPGAASLWRGPINGRTADGVTHVVLKRGDDTFESAFRGDRRIIETPLGWRPLADVAAMPDRKKGKPVGAVARMLVGYRMPPDEAEDLAGMVKDLMRSGESFVGELTEQNARALLPVPQGRGLEVTDVKGKVTFWTKDGVLVRYEYAVQGTVQGLDTRRLIEQTTITSIREIGSTRLNLPAEARMKIPDVR